MSKRTAFPRRARDWYATPPEAVLPLVPFLPRVPTAYVEPCAGDGALVRALADHWSWGVCALASDIEPRRAWIEEADAHEVVLPPCDLIVTNTPWTRPGSRGEPVVTLARRFAAHAPTWLLLPWDFAANGYFGSLAASCAQIVPVGRVSWMQNGINGYENAAWFLFDARHRAETVLMARAA